MGFWMDLTESDKYPGLKISGYISVNREENILHVFTNYDDGKILCIRFSPDTVTSQIGSLETDLTMNEYLDLLVECGKIDGYHEISSDTVLEVINMVY